MNERIKELAELSIKESGQEFWWSTNDLVIEKFAELIVRECIDSCLKVSNIRNIVPPTQDQVILWCVEEIQKKFGMSDEQRKD